MLGIMNSVLKPNLVQRQSSFKVCHISVFPLLVIICKIRTLEQWGTYITRTYSGLWIGTTKHT